MNISLSIVMINIAGTYKDLGHFAEVESSAAKARDTLKAARMTKSYVFATCKTVSKTCNLLFKCLCMIPLL